MNYDILLKKDNDSFETINDIIKFLCRIGKIKFDVEETDEEVRYEFAREYTYGDIKNLIENMEN